MNSIRRITSVDRRAAAAAAFGLAALAVAFLGYGQASGALHRASARTAVEAAEHLPRGMERDTALARAQLVTASAAAAAPRDPDTRLLEARALYLLATTAAVNEISMPLLEAAAAKLALVGENNSSAAAMRALIEIARNGQVATAAARDAVMKSYAGPPGSAEGALWRVEAAVRAWDSLPAEVQTAALNEACAVSAISPERRERVSTLISLRPEVFAGACRSPAPGAK